MAGSSSTSPQGMTSTQAVSRVKRLYQAAKAGHAGTLDPLATGVLPIALRRGDQDRPLRGRRQQGVPVHRPLRSRDRHRRRRGKAIARSDRRPSGAEIEARLPDFTGEIEQVPPRYSALKVDGARAYDLARDEEEFELAPRRVSIAWIRLWSTIPTGTARCSRRGAAKAPMCGRLPAISAARFGCYGHVEALAPDQGRSLRRGPRRDARGASKRSPNGGHDALMTALQPVETALADIPALAVSGPDADRLRRGQPVLLRGRDAPVVEGTVYAISRGTLIALGEVERGELHPKRIFNLPMRPSGVRVAPE